MRKRLSTAAQNKGAAQKMHKSALFHHPLLLLVHTCHCFYSACLPRAHSRPAIVTHG